VCGEEASDQGDSSKLVNSGVSTHNMVLLVAMLTPLLLLAVTVMIGSCEGLGLKWDLLQQGYFRLGCQKQLHLDGHGTQKCVD